MRRTLRHYTWRWRIGKWRRTQFERKEATSIWLKGNLILNHSSLNEKTSHVRDQGTPRLGANTHRPRLPVSPCPLPSGPKAAIVVHLINSMGCPFNWKRTSNTQPGLWPGPRVKRRCSGVFVCSHVKHLGSPPVTIFCCQFVRLSGPKQKASRMDRRDGVNRINRIEHSPTDTLACVCVCVWFGLTIRWSTVLTVLTGLTFIPARFGFAPYMAKFVFFSPH